MNRNLQLKRRLNISAAVILACGAVASIVIYLKATSVEENLLVDGFLESKAYRHELERYGGKLNVVSDDLLRWFNSLWQGETLAFTIATITLLIASLLFWLARVISTDLKG
ncbi:MAG: hypothetical protein HXX17_14640 [Geobacteraceae bacterium]|nr:hypothetical protein [Geobacteraceae bacterium]